MTFVLVVLLAAAAIVLIRETKKNKVLKGTVEDLKSQVNAPFDLMSLESVGAVLGGLTAEVVRIAYAAAAVCRRVNTVAQDLVDARKAQATEIKKTRKVIVELQAKVANAEVRLDALVARDTELDAITTLLPTK
jgi:hypothetical protein